MVGLSMGTIIALQVAVWHPERVLGLFLVSPLGLEEVRTFNPFIDYYRPEIFISFRMLQQVVKKYTTYGYRDLKRTVPFTQTFSKTQPRGEYSSHAYSDHMTPLCRKSFLSPSHIKSSYSVP